MARSELNSNINLKYSGDSSVTSWSSYLQPRQTDQWFVPSPFAPGRLRAGQIARCFRLLLFGDDSCNSPDCSLHLSVVQTEICSTFFDSRPLGLNPYIFHSEIWPLTDGHIFEGRRTGPIRTTCLRHSNDAGHQFDVESAIRTISRIPLSKI